MTYDKQRERLPETYFGVNRVLEINYFGHGDIFMSQWAGRIVEVFSDESVTRHKFNFAHGSEVVILAAALGYLRRIKEHERAELVLEDARDVIYHESGSEKISKIRTSYLQNTADGHGSPRFDIDELGMSALVVPIPNQPGTIDRVGGTGIYESHSLLGSSLAFVGIPSKYSGEELGERAMFLLPEEISVFTHMVCRMAVGEYRDNIEEFIRNQELGSASEE